MSKTCVLYFTILTCICLSSCGAPSKDILVKEFEGIVTYKADYIKPNDTTHYHDTIKCYYSHGNILKLHLGANPGKIKKDIYLTDENTRYGTFSIIDSVLCFDVQAKTDFDEKFTTTTSSEKILSHNCSKFIATATHIKHGIPLRTVVEYTYAKGFLPINKSHFREYNYDSFNNYTDQCNALYLNYKFSAYAPDGTITMGINYRAISAIETKVDPSVFKIDKTKLIKVRQP